MLYYVVDFTLFESVFRFSSLQLLVPVLFSWHRRCFLLVSSHVVMLFSGDSFWRLYCFYLFIFFFFFLVYSGYVLKICEHGVLGQAI